MKNKITYINTNGDSKFSKNQAVIMNDNGGGIKSFINTGNDIKFYGVVVTCGHCSRGYYIPILFSVIAESMEDAIEKVTHYPRVKFNEFGKNANAVLVAYEINPTEAYIIHNINNIDPYLCQGRGVNATQELVAREVILPDYIPKVQDERTHYMAIPKLAEDYDEKHVLQRLFAPSKHGDRYVYHKKYRKEDVLYPYFSQELKHSIPFNSDNVINFVSYLYLYGEPNDLGLTFKNNALHLKNGEKTISLPLNDDNVEFLEYQYEQRRKAEEIRQARKDKVHSPEKPMRSQLERFKARMEKYKQRTQSNNEEEKGNE